MAIITATSVIKYYNHAFKTQEMQYLNRMAINDRDNSAVLNPFAGLLRAYTSKSDQADSDRSHRQSGGDSRPIASVNGFLIYQ